MLVQERTMQDTREANRMQAEMDFQAAVEQKRQQLPQTSNFDAAVQGWTPD
jgi:hypothetical protein